MLGSEIKQDILQDQKRGFNFIEISFILTLLVHTLNPCLVLHAVDT